MKLDSNGSLLRVDFLLSMLYSIVSLIFLVSSTIVTLTFGLYGLFLIFFSIKGKRIDKFEKNESNPTISIVLPTYNEGRIIKKKVKNLLNSNHGLSKLEIIIADDSTDEYSRKLITELAKKDKRIFINRSEKRRGYSQSLLDAFCQTSGDIVIITDCGSLYDLNTIPELIKPFSDPAIGGVTGDAKIINVDEETGRTESFYRKIYNFMRKSESNADSTFHFHGEVSAVRRELLAGLQCFPTNLDIAIAFHIRKQGKKVYFNPNSHFYEYAPEKLKERHKQKFIRATGIIMVLLGYKGMLSTKYGLFGLIIYPAHLSMMILCPISIFSGSFAGIFLIISVPQLILILFLLFLILFLVKRELIVNFLQIEFVLLFAIWRALFHKEKVLFIEKIESTRR